MKNPHKAFSKVSPQREDGTRQINNEVFENLIKANLSGGEFKIVLFIIHKSWGFNKETDRISLTQFQRGTSLTRPAVVKSIKKLEARKIIVVNRGLLGNNRLLGQEYLFNKHYDTWVLVNNRLLVNRSDLVNKWKRGSKQMEQKVVNESLHTKESITKETIQKKKKLHKI